MCSQNGSDGSRNKAFKKLSMVKICPTCGKAKKRINFKRPQPGGKLPMKIQDECNLCYKVKKWYENLDSYDKDMCSLIENDDDYLGEIIHCKYCGQDRYGGTRVEHGGDIICDICWQQYCIGLWDLVVRD